MARPKKQDPNKKNINTVLYEGLEKMFKDVLKQPDATLVDKMRIADRFLKAEQIRLKVVDDGEGSFFNGPIEDEEGGENGSPA